MSYRLISHLRRTLLALGVAPVGLVPVARRGLVAVGVLPVGVAPIAGTPLARLVVLAVAPTASTLTLTPLPLAIVTFDPVPPVVPLSTPAAFVAITAQLKLKRHKCGIQCVSIRYVHGHHQLDHTTATYIAASQAGSLFSRERIRLVSTLVLRCR